MKILIADDESNVRSALKFILNQDREAVIVGEAEDATELVHMVRQQNPDLILLDWELPGLSSPGSTIEALRANRDHLKIIILSGDTHARKDSLEAGGNYFICKSDPPEKLLQSIQICLSNPATQ